MASQVRECAPGPRWDRFHPRGDFPAPEINLEVNSRCKPAKYRAVRPVADKIPWATPYVPGATLPERPFPQAGSYTLKGKSNGTAEVEIHTAGNSSSIESVAVTYHDLSDDGKIFLTGYENATTSSDSPTLNRIEWFSDLAQHGPGDMHNTKVTSDDGFHLRIDVLANRFDANGTITTTIGGKEYLQPLNGA
ncbi:hypothetical protein BJX66DRAFT_344330 [Aspergillus keveii]|uniref:Uncharacterized protein n=1 Tax=Aspergillus keveii TaxID=714993 RepID=A0ABR4FLN5_9EURO